jgi:predicted amidohydrolase YtcJ
MKIRRLAYILGLPLLALLSGLTGCGGSSGKSTPPPAPQVADSIYNNGVIETMNGSMATAQAVAVAGGEIIGVGTDAQIAVYQGPNTNVVNLNGQALLPGFIDTHSHMMGWGAGYVNIRNGSFVDISSVNVFFKPLPGDPRCANASDYQNCFIPVQTQDDVIARLQAAVAAAPSPTTPIVGFNYDPSRLGQSKECAANGVGFACPNFEDGHALTYLDQLSSTNPISITSESGHIVYVNSVELAALNICQPNKPQVGCTVPSINPPEEEAMAQYGQLNEDLALAAESQIAAGNGSNPSSFVTLLKSAAQAYAQHGYTFIQEGAASPAETAVYELATLDPQFPVTAAPLIYDPKATDGTVEVVEALALKAVTKNNPNLLVAGPKYFADGSTQGLTGYVGGNGYLSLFDTLYSPAYGIWPQPYVGAADFSEAQLASAAVLAHEAKFPIFIHQNGNGAIQNALTAMQMAGTTPALRDLMIHFSGADASQIALAQKLGVGVTLLTENLYYYGLQFCQQIIGPQDTAALYPAASAFSAGLHVSLHPDSPVTPPYPLFAIWVAKTRTTQQPSWYPNLNPNNCPVVQGANESITIAQGIQAYTTEAAWEYGLDNELGSIEVGKTADFVILSADPLAMENTPNDLSTIRTIATVHNGTYFANPNASQPPIWPN